MAKSPNRITKQKQVRSGLYLYQTPRSPFWYAKVWVPSQQKYFSKSTKETDRLEATQAAINFADKTLSTIGTVERNPKATRFETYADRFDANLRASVGNKSRKYIDYHNTLYRHNDGLIAFFGDMQIKTINTGKMRDYLHDLDIKRDKPLSGSTKKKHIMVLRAVMRMAFEDEQIERVPDPPKIMTKDNPRTAFTDSQYKQFIRAANTCVKQGDKVSGISLTQHHVHIFRFIVHTFVRPTTGELFFLRHRDIQIRSNPPRLEMVIRKGKTGLRESFTMPFAVAVYKSILRENAPPDASISQIKENLADEFVFMAEYDNRAYARTALSRIFLHFLRAAKLDQLEESFSTYSLRHYALQKRVRDSKSKVNINLLAKNAGTSVEMLERYYLSKMAPSPEIIAEFQRND